MQLTKLNFFNYTRGAEGRGVMESEKDRWFQPFRDAMISVIREEVPKSHQGIAIEKLDVRLREAGSLRSKRAVTCAETRSGI